MFKYLRDNDKMVFPSYKHIHGFKEDKKKTVIGGFICTFIKILMIYIVINLGQRIFGFGDFIISSNIVVYKDYWEKVPLKDTSKILIEVW